MVADSLDVVGDRLLGRDDEVVVAPGPPGQVRGEEDVVDERLRPLDVGERPALLVLGADGDQPVGGQVVEVAGGQLGVEVAADDPVGAGPVSIFFLTASARIFDAILRRRLPSAIAFRWTGTR